jgi:sugar/nucleoside kinase (ribokinase family)
MVNLVFVNARAKALGASLLGKDRLNRMLECDGAEEALKILYEVNFGGGLQINSAVDFERLIDAENDALNAFLRSYGMDENIAGLHKKILSHTSHIMPSWTEAAFLTGRDYTQHPTADDLWQTAEDLQTMGAANVVITSSIVDGTDYTACLDANGEKSLLACDHIPVKVAGTGDLFAAFYMAEVLSGGTVAQSARVAMDRVRALVDLSKNDDDTLRGVHLAQHLQK